MCLNTFQFGIGSYVKIIKWEIAENQWNWFEVLNKNDIMQPVLH